MKSVSEEDFNLSKQARLVKLNGDAFSGTLEEFKYNKSRKTNDMDDIKITCYSTWAPGKPVKNTMEGVGLIPASGFVEKKAFRPVRINGKTEIINCGEISFKTFGLKKNHWIKQCGTWNS